MPNIQIKTSPIDDATLQKLAKQAVEGWFGLTGPVPLNPQSVQYSYEVGWQIGFKTAEIYYGLKQSLADEYRKELSIPTLSDDLLKLIDIRILKLLPELVSEAIKIKTGSNV